jgi:hypothetical protein
MISMNAIEVGENWITSLDMYQGIDGVKVENAYIRALALLSEKSNSVSFSNLFGELYTKVRIRKIWKFDDKFENDDEEFLVACIGFFYPAIVDLTSDAIPKLEEESELIKELAIKHFL